MAASQLPPASDLPVDRLAALFSSTTNAYKYLFFLALLDLLEATPDRADFSMREILVRLLENAWYPHTYFRLSFGRQDQVARTLDEMKLAVKATTPGAEQRKQLRAAIEKQLTDKHVAKLSRFVPQRLIRPFFAREQLSGYADHKVDARLASLSRDRYDLDRPLYRLDGDQVWVHPRWVEYLRVNGALVRGWALWSFASYMQSRNPNVPAVAAKLVPAPERGSIPAPARKLWTRAREQLGGLECPYSQAPVPEDFALDHFVPWTFVVHDQLWNLVPVDKSLNSSKGNRLPPASTLDRLVSAHARALVAARPTYEGREWSTVVEPYIADLGVSKAALDAPDDPQAIFHALKPHYAQTLLPLLDLAKTRGFEAWSPI